MTLGKHVPYIFHANWLPGNEKQTALDSTNNWYVRAECAGKEPYELTNLTGGIYEGCCMHSHHVFVEENKTNGTSVQERNRTS
jgi:hypothetical protein